MYYDQFIDNKKMKPLSNASTQSQITATLFTIVTLSIFTRQLI